MSTQAQPDQNPTRGRSVIIIGGGVAGLAAAVALADEGFKITLIEKRALLGGRASSFIDAESGDRVDNCQHVTMKCCTNLEDFYRRVGVADKIHYFDALTFLDGRGVFSRIKSSFLPAPLHTLPSFLTFRALSLRDKIAIGRALMQILRTRPADQLDETSMEEFLARSKQTARAIDRFWRPILVSACNEDLDRISCASAFKIFRDGFLVHPEAYKVGLPTVPLGDLYTEPALSYLRGRSAEVRFKEHVDEIIVSGKRVEGLKLSDGSTISADYYLSAIPFDLLLKVLPEETTALPYFQPLQNLQFSPITGVHLWFDRKLDIPPATAILDREIQWIFNKTENYNQPDTQCPIPNTYLGLVVSSAKRLAEMPRDEIVRLSLEEVCQCFPQVREAKLVKSHVIKERKATFSPAPGVDRFRPSQRTPIHNLFLAGDWTATGWPATMEGGVRSGYLAAESILAAEGEKRRILQPDLEPSSLAKALMGRR